MTNQWWLYHLCGPVSLLVRFCYTESQDVLQIKVTLSSLKNQPTIPPKNQNKPTLPASTLKNHTQQGIYWPVFHKIKIAYLNNTKKAIVSTCLHFY